MQGNETWAAGAGRISSRKVNSGQRVAPSSLKDMTNDKDTLDIYRHRSLEPAAESDKKGKKEDLLLASFLALALDLILSACRFLSSSSVSPEAATTLSSSHQHCQFGHLRTCAQAIQSDTLAGAKKLSNVFIIITFLSYRLPFRSLISSPPPLPPPPPALPSPSHLPSLPPYRPRTLVPLLTPTNPHPPHSALASTFLDFYPFNSDNLVFSNRRWTQWGMVRSRSY